MESLNGTIVFLEIINLTAFIIYAIDKLLAKIHFVRVPEIFLLLLAAFGGSVGAYLAMQVFRHKTLHLKFKFGIPLIFCAQIAAVVYFSM